MSACLSRRVTFISKSQLYPELGATYLTSLNLNFCSSESQDTLPCGAGMWVVGVMGRAPQHCKFFPSPEGWSPKVGRGGQSSRPRSAASRTITPRGAGVLTSAHESQLGTQFSASQGLSK